ncbi:flagellar filament capping protein FliD [Undibacterium sp. Jales W-56]|uniref:flagellar filament capping protein FliD n=1 Tax=Undibacterium sp. Jales W-56 TaxID=2897325 RepID=UPI0021D2BC08|nr:flagellar filament capping protein FliD [Undibacterium sp. Jales W-56]MCU6432828.1 flagellar filament capping protein FliD [Undibacterium sp. Jales W-56]
MAVSPIQYATNGYIDVYKTVGNLLASRNTTAPQLNTLTASYQVAISSLGKIQASLQSLQTAAQGIAGGSLNIFTAVSSAPSVLSATASSTAKSGTYALNVTQLAQSQTLTSSAQTSQTAAIGTGAATVIKFDFGTTAGTVFTANAAAPSKSITIDASNNSLQGIAAAVNKANIGVTAKVAFDGVNYKLAFTSASGASNSLRISATGDAAVQGLVAYDPAGVKNLTQTAAAQDASLTVNGVAVTSASNTITTAISGVTLNLTAIGTSNLTIAPDATQIAKTVGSFVSAYNALQADLTASLKDGSAAPNRSVIQTIQNQLRTLVGSSPSGLAAGSSYTALSQIGVTTQKDGTLGIDDTKLRAAINANPANVTALLTNSGAGIADQVGALTKSLLAPTSALSVRSADLGRAVSAVDASRVTLTYSLTSQANSLISQYTRLSLNLNSLASTSSLLSATLPPR